MYRICHFDQLEPFLVSLISPDDHWLFASTSGALTAGRRSPERALFPYETDDRLHRAGGLRGPVTALACARAGSAPVLWRPFHALAAPGVTRNLYKSELGDRLVFEEHHAELDLTFTACWSTSRRFGIVRTATLQNGGPDAVSVAILDGLVDLEPALVLPAARQALSCLVDAYTRTERVADLPLAVCSLESRLVDRPEPAEALRATMVWSVGLDGAAVLLREDALRAFVSAPATDLLGPALFGTDAASLSTGRRGAFLLSARLSLAPSAAHAWHIVGEVHADHSTAAAVVDALAQPRALRAALEADLDDGRHRLRRLAGAVDGLQLGADQTQTAALASSALFNAMRGGLPVDGHRLPAADLAAFIATRSPATAERHRATLAALEDGPVDDLLATLAEPGDPDLRRLSLEYLPFWFSRRHGDPSRPWNHFTIRILHPDGSRRLHWQGNWRDIFQNWEALCESFPGFALGTVVSFVDACTADGGNPYRISRDGVDWEVPEPDHPWSHLGYWGDHQIVYAARLIELTRRVRPGRLEALLDAPIFTYADIPYRIAPYAALRADPHDTITFDVAHQAAIERRVAERGADGRLLHRGGALVRVTLSEKLLVPLLAKLSNLVLGGGIWMNTQRPEWNDANNALVGWGLSVVTTCQLLRYCNLLVDLLEAGPDRLRLSAEVHRWFADLFASLRDQAPALESGLDDRHRAAFLDAVGEAFSRYRQTLYASGLSAPVDVDRADALALLTLARTYLEHTIGQNRRSDGLYHAYNLMRPTEAGIALGRLPLMLEGQVAALESGAVSPEDASALVEALFASALYRPDQRSFMLYPIAQRPSFLGRNQVPESALRLPIVARWVEARDTRVIGRDATGTLRFQADLANGRDLAALLDTLPDVDTADRAALLALWEEVFHHHAFTGRSGTMHAYEGIGSIYWHMVSKLQLAVAEAHDLAQSSSTAAGLARAYHAIRDGLGPAKPPSVQGAFPTDPHSHTPLHRGAQQPGMTGQAKEAVLVRRRELGVAVADGIVHLDPRLLPTSELLEAPGELDYVDSAGEDRRLAVPAGAFAFTFCQVPVLITAHEGAADAPARVRWFWRDGSAGAGVGQLDPAASHAVLYRTGLLDRVEVAAARARLFTPGTGA